MFLKHFVFARLPQQNDERIESNIVFRRMRQESIPNVLFSHYDDPRGRNIPQYK